ncbi:MAG: AtpZ/AtpI family protein [Cytophagales bacterium]|nr:MAG: AtpZ/AtpI family protein [Cytophagales bacterium]TAF60851.1 MAG: AtpZ/AtpI family protein [Cytophagales bacterium]
MQLKPSPFLKYSGLAFEMIAALALGAFLGNWLDEKNNNQTSYWTLGLSFLFLVASFWRMVISLQKSNKSKD